jgi:hypothetical protein
MSNIKVFVGCDPNGADAESMAVLEYTLRKHSSRPVELHWMQMTKDKQSPWYTDQYDGWNTTAWPTPFSGFRWGVPLATNYTGRAIYMDSDMIIQRDIAELYDMPLEDNKIVAAKSPDRFCVCLWDCEKFGNLVNKRMLPNPKERRSDAMFHETMKRGFIMNSGCCSDFRSTME